MRSRLHCEEYSLVALKFFLQWSKRSVMAPARVAIDPHRHSEATSVQERLEQAYRELALLLDVAMGAFLLQRQSVLSDWERFATALRGWLECERAVLFPLIESLAVPVELRRLQAGHAALEQTLERATCLLGLTTRDEFIDVVEQLMTALTAQAVRERRRFAGKLDTVLPTDDRAELVARLRCSP
jgi:hypothetical protein